ncbi:MAG: hypothetical protein ACPG77_00015 [Nannocystaceae bacterium]
MAVLDISGAQNESGDISWVGDDRWRPIVMEAVRLREIAGEPSVRVLVGEHAVLISGDDKHVVGVVFIKGHPVVKSVVRMVRQLLRAPSPKAAKAAAKVAVQAIPSQPVAPVAQVAPTPAAPAPAPAAAVAPAPAPAAVPVPVPVTPPSSQAV